MKQLPSCKSINIELVRLNQIGMPLQNQVSRQAAGGGGVHDSVSGKAVYEE
jgi:hypothetical protein